MNHLLKIVGKVKTYALEIALSVQTLVKTRELYPCGTDCPFPKHLCQASRATLTTQAFKANISWADHTGISFACGNVLRHVDSF
jgi:hypothetical protein